MPPRYRQVGNFPAASASGSSNLWQSIRDIGGKIGDWFTGVFDGIANAFDTWSDAIRNVINTVIGWINKIPGVNIDLITDPAIWRPAGGWVAPCWQGTCTRSVRSAGVVRAERRLTAHGEHQRS